jgi:hypothetical protein
VSRQLNRKTRLEVEGLEDRFLATVGLTSMAVAPLKSTQPVYAVVAPAPTMQILGLDGNTGSLSKHLDYKSGLRTNHNETLVRDGVRKARCRRRRMPASEIR